MITPAKRMAPHILARRLLSKRIQELLNAGVKQLPGERALCKDIGVGAVTLRKVIRQLSSEGRILCVPRKGNFIGEMPERLNIGLIIGDGSTVSFLGEPCALSGILDTLEKSSVYMRTVQVREPERAPGIFKEYGLDGCIWYLPGNSLFPRIRKALMETGVPVVAMMLYEYSQAEAEHLPNFRVEPDFQGIGRLRAEFMLGRGHRKIACFTKPESEVYKGFISAIAGAGAVHSPDWAIRSGEIFEKIPRLLDEGEATAMIVNGGSTEMEKVFQALEGHPRGGDIELLVDYCGHMLPGMIARHPKLRVVAVNHYPGRELGMEAAKALLGNIQGGLPPAPLKLISQIRKPDGTSFN